MRSAALQCHQEGNIWRFRSHFCEPKFGPCIGRLTFCNSRLAVACFVCSRWPKVSWAIGIARPCMFSGDSAGKDVPLALPSLRPGAELLVLVPGISGSWFNLGLRVSISG